MRRDGGWTADDSEENGGTWEETSCKAKENVERNRECMKVLEVGGNSSKTEGGY